MFRKKTTATKSQQPQGNVPYGVEYWYVRFNNWTDSLESNSAFWRNVIIGLAIIVAIVVGAGFLPFSQAVQSYFVVPGALLLFLILLAVTRRLVDSEDRVTIREKFSARQRRKGGIPIAVLALGVFVFANTKLPYLVGGLIFMTLLFVAYNTLRRTPEEIKMDLAGVVDPRDFTPEPEEDVNEELYEQTLAELELEEAIAAELELEEAIAAESEIANSSVSNPPADDLKE